MARGFAGVDGYLTTRQISAEKAESNHKNTVCPIAVVVPKIQYTPLPFRMKPGSGQKATFALDLLQAVKKYYRSRWRP